MKELKRNPCFLVSSKSNLDSELVKKSLFLVSSKSNLDSELVKELFGCCDEGKEWGNIYENGCDNFPVPVKNVSAKNQVH